MKRRKRIKKPGNLYKRKVNNRMRDFGTTDTKKKVITINKKLSKTKSMSGGKAKPGGVIDTIVHEEYHARHPKATEKTTYKKTKKLVKKMSKKQKKKAYSKFR